MIKGSLLFPLFLTLLVGPGCVSKQLNRRLSERIDSVSGQTRDIDRLINESGSYPLEWKDALKLLSERSQNLRRSRERSEEILKERNEQWKDWVPRPSLFSSLNTSLSELGNLSFSDLNTSVIAPLFIPNPYTERAKAYENSLSYLESKDSYEVSYRREVISLYQIYSRMAQIEKSMATAEERDANSVSGGLGILEARMSDKVALDSVQSQLVQILNLPGARPLPVASSRPELDFERRIERFVPGRNYGLLAVRLSAYRIEGALLREKGVKMRKWPSVSASTSTPALYNSRNDGRQDFTDSEQINLFGGLTKSYDLVGADVDYVKSAKQNTEFVKQSLRLQLDRDSREWSRLKNQYRALIIKKKIAGEHLANINRGMSGGDTSAELKQLREGIKSNEQLANQKEQLDLQIWTWDDASWK